jgi:Di-sulfide bridge nucleocytoplasmic transport domain
MCASQYKNNLCGSNPIPAMVHQCASWETCMNRDPTVVGRAKVGAEMIAEVVNSFVEPISWKTLVR